MKGLLDMHKKFLWASVRALGLALCVFATMSTDGSALRVENDSGQEFKSSLRAWVVYQIDGRDDVESIEFPEGEYKHALKVGKVVNFHHAGLKNDSFKSVIRTIQGRGGKIEGFYFDVNVEVPYGMPSPVPGGWNLTLEAKTPDELIQKLDSAKMLILPGVSEGTSEENLIFPELRWVETE
ncbi:MAG: hypothetical protein K2X28_00740 [Alphaproteobacteria bacterium]|nr:hypothetical protein [Alphaproteobacteria bacterium]